MPRRPYDQQHGPGRMSRYVRHLHHTNRTRYYEKTLLGMWGTCRYHHLTEYDDPAIIRNPNMQPLIHKGKKHARG